MSCGCTVYPLVYAWLLAYHSGWGAVHERLLSECVQLKSQLLAMWESPTETLKPLVIKFSEVVALTLTNDRPNAQRAQTQGQRDELRTFTLRDLPPHHRELDAAKLREEARAAFALLVTCTPSVATTFSALLKSLGSLSKLRSAQFGSEVADRLHELADTILMEEAQLQILPSEQQVKRVKADVKATIVDVLRALNPSVSSADQQQAKLVEALQGLGADAEARELTRQMEKRKAQHTRQIADAHTMDLGANSHAGLSAAASPAVVPTVEYDLVADADSHEMHILAFHLSQLPAHSITQLVVASLQHFVPPLSVLQQTHTRELSSLFVQFVTACNQNPAAPTSKARSSLDQRQTAEMMLAQAAMATSMTPAAAAAGELSLVPMQRAASLPPVSTLTAVPPIPVPTISEKGYESLSRSAFARIASVKTQQSVARSGESTLRNVILAKLAATNLVHPLRYTHMVDPELDAADPAASQWSSSLVATENHQLLSTAITQDWSSYDNALNWLYSLLVVDPENAIIDTKIKRKAIAEMDGTDETENDDKTEGTDSAANTATPTAASADTPDDAPMNHSGDTKDDAAVSASSTGSKRKRDDDGADLAEAEVDDGDDATVRDNKRVRSSAAVSASAAAPSLSSLPPFSVHGTVEYEETLSRLLKSLESSPLFGTAAAASSSRQNLYSRFLLDIPLLTPAVFQSIDGCVYDPARSVIGLSTLRDLILYRPPVRTQSLDLLLSYTWKPDQSKLRNQSIRLVVNHLFTPNPHLRAPIIAHAHHLLDALALPQTLEDLPEIVVNVVVPPVPVYDKIVLPPLPKEKSAGEAAAANSADTPVKTENGASLPTSSPPLVGQSSTESRRSLGDLRTRQEIASMIADADRRKREFDRLVFFRSLREKEKKLLEQQRDERVKRRTDRIARHLELYMALCTRQPSMLRRLLSVYRRCDEFVRKCVHDQIPPLITALMRLDQDMLVHMLEQETIGAKDEAASASSSGDSSASSADSSPLVLHALQLMTDRAPPSPSLVSSVQRMLAAHPDNPRYLIPILPGLPADAIRRHLPRLIALPADALRVAFRKLLHSKPPAAIKPAELMVALHLMQPDNRKRTAGQPTPSDAQLAKERKEDEDALDKRVTHTARAHAPSLLAVSCFVPFSCMCVRCVCSGCDCEEALFRRSRRLPSRRVGCRADAAERRPRPPSPAHAHRDHVDACAPVAQVVHRVVTSAEADPPQGLHASTAVGRLHAHVQRTPTAEHPRAGAAPRPSLRAHAAHAKHADDATRRPAQTNRHVRANVPAAGQTQHSKDGAVQGARNGDAKADAAATTAANTHNAITTSILKEPQRTPALQQTIV